MTVELIVGALFFGALLVAIAFEGARERWVAGRRT